MTHIARWESKSGKHWVNLHSDKWGHHYESPGAFGSLGNKMTDEKALENMEFKISMGGFQPDANKTPMKRVPVSNIPPSEEVSNQTFDPKNLGEAVGKEWHENLFNDKRPQ